ncbi:MAG: hypothetical protein DMF61_21635 [Blastocatellia bacterium AA13]|nr:MAG: hypothetical protein DMF61_21635 [Blastocatellia bacterium AA13]
MKKDERGFTLIEVCVASIVIMTGLVSLATLFTLALKQNRTVKQFISSTAIAQQKIEELSAIDVSDARLAVGGNLTAAATNYADQLTVDESTGAVTATPNGQVASYFRYWKIEADPASAGNLLSNTIIISVRVVAAFGGQGKTPEETTLTTARRL